MKNSFTFHSPVTAHFGPGSRKLLTGLLFAFDRVGVVSGGTTLDKSGMGEYLATVLESKDSHLFTEVEPNPSIETVRKGAEFFRRNDCQAVVAVGGGSAMDAAKAMAGLAVNEGTFEELMALDRLPVTPLPVIAFPTTCGTGSEMNHYAIITDPVQKDKVNFSAANTFPEHAILDPELLNSLSPELVAATAFDALTHALEGYISLRANPFSDHLALAAMERIIAALSGNRNLKTPECLAELLYSSALAGVVILHTGTTLLHALGYYLTNHKGIHHGTANAVLLPAFLSMLKNGEVKKYEVIAGLFDRYDFRTRKILERFARPTSLTSLLDDGELQIMVDYAVEKKNSAVTPFPVDPGKIAAELAGLLSAG